MSLSLPYGRTFAEARPASVAGRTAIGGYLLQFSVELSVAAAGSEQAEALATDWQAVICAGRRGAPLKFLGYARPEVPLALRSHAQFDNRTFLGLGCLISQEQLAALETERQGGDLSFQVQLWAQARYVVTNAWPLSDEARQNASEERAQDEQNLKEQVAPISDSVSYHLTISDWSTVLEQLEYRRLMVFGLEMPFAPKDELFASGHALILKAGRHLVEGRYEDVIASCRRILESIAAAAGEAESAQRAAEKYRIPAQRKNMSKVERSLLLQEVVRFYTHLSHHVDDSDGGTQYYSRDDATFCLSLAVGVYQDAAARRAGRASGESVQRQ